MQGKITITSKTYNNNKLSEKYVGQFTKWIIEIKQKYDICNKVKKLMQFGYTKKYNFVF